MAVSDPPVAAAGPPDPGEGSAANKRHSIGLILLSTVAVLLAPFSMPTFGAGAACALAVLVIAHRRRASGGWYLRGPVIGALVALVLSAVSGAACYMLFLRPNEVRGEASERQGRIEDRFDRAFEEAKAPPPPRDGGPADGGRDDVRDPAGAAMRDAGPDPGHDVVPSREKP